MAMPLDMPLTLADPSLLDAGRRAEHFTVGVAQDGLKTGSARAQRRGPSSPKKMRLSSCRVHA